MSTEPGTCWAQLLLLMGHSPYGAQRAHSALTIWGLGAAVGLTPHLGQPSLWWGSTVTYSRHWGTDPKRTIPLWDENPIGKGFSPTAHKIPFISPMGSVPPALLPRHPTAVGWGPWGVDPILPLGCGMGWGGDESRGGSAAHKVPQGVGAAVPAPQHRFN